MTDIGYVQFTYVFLVLQATVQSVQKMIVL